MFFFLQFFMLNICLSLKIELLWTFLTYNSYSLAFQKTFYFNLYFFSTAVVVSGDKAQYSSSLSACNRVKMGAGYWDQRQRWRVTFAFYTLFLRQTVNGKAGPFGTALKAVHSSSCMFKFHTVNRSISLFSAAFFSY